MQESEEDYLRRRAAEELAAADGIDDPVAAQVHRRLASLYVSKADDIFGDSAPIAGDQDTPDPTPDTPA